MKTKKTNSIQQLTFFYIGALSTIVLLLLIGQGLIQYALNQEIAARNTATEIGKQRGRVSIMIIDMERMLRFRVGYQATLNDLHSQVDEWQIAQDAAYHGNVKLNIPATLNPDIRNHINATKVDYETLQGALALLFTNGPDTTSINDALQTFLTRGPPYQLNMLYVFDKMNSQADTEVVQIQHIEISLFAATLIAIALEYLLVFRQATKQLKIQFALLSQVAAKV